MLKIFFEKNSYEFNNDNSHNIQDIIDDCCKCSRLTCVGCNYNKKDVYRRDE